MKNTRNTGTEDSACVGDPGFEGEKCSTSTGASSPSDLNIKWPSGKREKWLMGHHEDEWTWSVCGRFLSIEWWEVWGELLFGAGLVFCGNMGARSVYLVPEAVCREDLEGLLGLPNSTLLAAYDAIWHAEDLDVEACKVAQVLLNGGSEFHKAGD